MTGRREMLLDAAIRVLGGGGARALTHRAVDAEAGVGPGSTANYFSTRDALAEAIVERVSEQERQHFDELAATASPTTPVELGRLLGAFCRGATGTHRQLTLARYAVLVEAGHNTRIRQHLAATGGRVNTWFATWLRLIGVADVDRGVHTVGNYLTGLMLHQLALHDPHFDPTDKITTLLASLVDPPPDPERAPARRRADGRAGARGRPALEGGGDHGTR